MKRFLRGVAIAGLAAGIPTALLIARVGRPFGPLVGIVSAPAALVSILSFQWIQSLNAISPRLYSGALVHFTLIQETLFFLVTVVWFAAVFSPPLFGVRFFRLSIVASQAWLLFAAAVISLMCFYVLISSFTPIITSNQTMQRTADPA